MTMSKRMDKLFKDKLTDHLQTPSENAWKRVEANLSKKNKGITWFRMAAALLVIGVVTATAVWIKSQDTHQRPAQLSMVIKSRKTVSQKKQQPKKSRPMLTLQDQAEKKNRRWETSTFLKAVVVRVQPDTLRTKSSLALEPTVPPATKVDPEQKTIAVIEKPEKPIVLEYRLDPIESKKPDVRQPIVMGKEKNGLQKVLDFARDAKNSEGPLSELRLVKNEFFALNFRKDKTKNAK